MRYYGMGGALCMFFATGRFSSKLVSYSALTPPAVQNYRQERLYRPLRLSESTTGYIIKALSWEPMMRYAAVLYGEISLIADNSIFRPSVQVYTVLK